MSQISLELHHQISQFLYREAKALDDWDFRAWLTCWPMISLIRCVQLQMRRPVTVAVRYNRQPPGF